MKPQALYFSVLSELGAAIVAGNPQPGEVLRVEDLCERFKVSRTVVREAVRVLESLQMVRVTRHVGITIAPSSLWNVYDPRLIRWKLENAEQRAEQRRSLGQLRMTLEPLAARLTAESASLEQREELLRIARNMAELDPCHGDSDAFVEHMIDFHTGLLKYSHNELFAALIPVMREAHLILAPRYDETRAPVPEMLRLRIHVAEAIVAGDGLRAERAVRGMVTSAVYFWPHLVERPSDATS